MRRISFVLILGVLCGPATAAPFVPANDSVVIERLPGASDPRLATLRRLHAALARQPDNLTLAVAVATRDVAEARGRADPRFNGYAQAALLPWWRQAAPPLPVRLLRALVEQNQHLFTAALADLDAILAAQPGNAQARLTRAVVRQVEADYAGAAADCAAAGDPAELLAASVCRDNVRALQGEAAAALADLRRSMDALGSVTPAAVKLWALTVAAELAQYTNDNAAAEADYRAALDLAPADAYALAGYADFLLDHGRPAEVMALLAGFTRIDTLLLRLAIAERRLRAEAAEAHVNDLADRFAASTARHDAVHRREQARFMLELSGAPHAALALALDDWRVQREPADARVVLECAAAAGDAAGAAPVLAWLARTGLPDARMQALARRLNPAEHPASPRPVVD